MSAGVDTASAPIDGGRAIDWSRTSADYATHRPGPPARLYDLLAALDAWLQANTAPTFTVRHRIDAHVLSPWPTSDAAATPALAEKGFSAGAD